MPMQADAEECPEGNDKRPSRIVAGSPVHTTSPSDVYSAVAATDPRQRWRKSGLASAKEDWREGGVMGGVSNGASGGDGARDMEG